MRYTYLVLLLWGLGFSFSGCEQQLAVEKLSAPDSLTTQPLISSDFNFLVRNATQDTVSIKDPLEVEFYVRQVDKQVGEATYQFSFAVAGGDGDLSIGKDILRQNDQSRLVNYIDLTNNRITARYTAYRLSPVGQTTFTFTCRDNQQRIKTASISLYLKK